MTMKCDQVMELLADAGAAEHTGQTRALSAHLAGCDSCRHADRALSALRSDRRRPVPEPPRGAFDRAIRAAVDAPRAAVRARRRGFWLGTAVGSALAASIALAVVTITPTLQTPSADGTPQVTLALHEPRDVHIALESPEALTEAQIRVVIRGAVGLLGFEGERELQWTTDLDQGLNRLTLPVVATGSDGGQLFVEVLHGTKRRTFVVDVRAAQAADGSLI